MGTRPDAIKQLPVFLALRATDWADPILISSGQHLELLDDVFAVFDVHPTHKYDAFGTSTLVDLSSSLIGGLSEIFGSLALDGLVVQGDTTTSFIGAYVAFLLGVPVFHVEAGLRTSTIENPFPEEANRRLITRLSTLHFAPTPRNRTQLLQEGVPADSVVVTGNTGLDSLFAIRARSYRGGGPKNPTTPTVLVTAHRRESWGTGIKNICHALERLAIQHRDIKFIIPSHPNPEIVTAFTSSLGELANVRIVSALPYDEMARAIVSSKVLITDSGGMQEEAAALGIPTVVLRDETERTEAVDAGVAFLVGTSPDRIFAEVDRLLTDNEYYAARAVICDSYGTGHAATMIGDRLAEYFDQAFGADVRDL